MTGYSYVYHNNINKILNIINFFIRFCYNIIAMILKNYNKFITYRWYL